MMAEAQCGNREVNRIHTETDMQSIYTTTPRHCAHQRAQWAR